MDVSSVDWLVGIDLGRKSRHRAVVLDRRTGKRARSDLSVPRTDEGAEQLLEALADGGRCAVMMEPTGNIWRPVAAALVAAGHRVYLVSPKTASRLRKALSDHAKSDRIDADTLARLPLVKPDELNRLHLPPTELARLRDLARHRDRLSEEVSDRKRRIQDLIEQVQPTLMEALGQKKFQNAHRAFLRKYVDPRRVVRLGETRFYRFLDRRHHRGYPAGRAAGVFEAARSAAALLERQEADTRPFDLEQLQQEVRLELDLMEVGEEQLERLQNQIDALYEELDPEGMLRTLPGFGRVVAPTVLGETGALARFPNGGSYRGYVSLIPRYRTSGTSGQGRQKIRKAGPRLLKKYFYLAADKGRQWDVELAALYHRCRHEKGHTHRQAVCAVANNLAGRAYAVMKRMAEGKNIPYEFRDLDGRPISRREARQRVLTDLPGPVVAKKQRQATEADNNETEEGAAMESNGSRPARRPSAACTRPPQQDASSSKTGSPHRTDEVLKKSFPELIPDA